MTIKISKIIETKDVFQDLIKLNILSQYKAKKDFLQNWFLTPWTRLKLREPKKDNVWYFRINNQYRALAKYENEELKVFSIDNHQ